MTADGLTYAAHVRQIAYHEGNEYAVTAHRPDPDTGGTLLRLAPGPNRDVPDHYCRWVPMRACAYVRTLTPAGWVTEVCRPTD